MMAASLQRLARLRVPLGFVFGAAAWYLAHPTWRSIATGVAIGLCGQTLRLWAAGHLEKSREVTQSGPYRYTRHPLYVGSSLMALGLAIATRSWPVAVLVAVYMAVTLTAAIRTEEAFLRERFGDEYDAYASRRGARAERRFSFARAWRNREYRAIAGFVLAIALLGMKVTFG
jgi:protein-S-isoprenylcysteine O-methyltransferase Ste14